MRKMLSRALVATVLGATAPLPLAAAAAADTAPPRSTTRTVKAERPGARGGATLTFVGTNKVDPLKWWIEDMSCADSLDALLRFRFLYHPDGAAWSPVHYDTTCQKGPVSDTSHWGPTNKAIRGVELYVNVRGPNQKHAVVYVDNPNF